MKLSKEFGLNASLLCCYICGKEIGIALLGDNHGKEAPKTICDGSICDDCRTKYIQILEVENETNKKITGRFVYIPKDAIKVECPEGKAFMDKEEFTKSFL